LSGSSGSGINVSNSNELFLDRDGITCNNNCLHSAIILRSMYTDFDMGDTTSGDPSSKRSANEESANIELKKVGEKFP
jgi:hypothetical protein